LNSNDCPALNNRHSWSGSKTTLKHLWFLPRSLATRNPMPGWICAGCLRKQVDGANDLHREGHSPKTFLKRRRKPPNLFQRQTHRLATRCRTLGRFDNLHHIDIKSPATTPSTDLLLRMQSTK